MEKKKIFLLVCLAVMLLAIFLPWFSINLGFIGVSISGWTIHWLFKVTALLVIASGILVYIENKSANLLTLITSIFGLGSVILLIISGASRIPAGLAGTAASSILKFTAFGFYLFIIAGIVVLVTAIKARKKPVVEVKKKR